MAEKKNPPIRRKVVFRPAPPMLKIAACLLILFSMAALLALRWVHNGIREETQILTDQAAAAQAENAELTEKIGALLSSFSTVFTASFILAVANSRTAASTSAFIS